jgi:hypothetical protein
MYLPHTTKKRTNVPSIRRECKMRLYNSAIYEHDMYVK